MTWQVHLEDLVRFGQLGKRMYVMQGNPASAAFGVLLNPTIKTHEQYSGVQHEDAFLDDSRSPANDVRGFLQAMSDAAWEIGIKPKQLEDSRNELAAVRYHLEDMRLLAKVKP